MMSQFYLWSSFEYIDWISYLDFIKTNPLKLYAFLPFVTKVLGIDMIPDFCKLEKVPIEISEYVNGIEASHYYFLRESDISFYNKSNESQCPRNSSPSQRQGDN